MARLIVQGSSEETKKVVSALRNSFDVVNNRATVLTSEGGMTVIEVFSDQAGKDKYTTEEVMKALYCCSHRERKCPECPYRKEQDCKERLAMDGAITVRRMLP